jgi:ADP-ribose pyrophosphatase
MPEEQPSRPPRRVEVLAQERLLDGFFKVDRARVRYERYDGQMSAPHTREVFERGDTVALLLYDRAQREVVLVQQFRYPAHVRGGPGWLWEIIAGVQEEGRAAEDVARSEALEEAGYRLETLRAVLRFYASPGGSSECKTLFLAAVTPAQRVEPGGGLLKESEDILVRAFPLDEALAMVEDGRIMDAKTIIALYYLARHWDDL